MGDRLKDKVALVSGAGSSGPGWGNGKATQLLWKIPLNSHFWVLLPDLGSRESP
jgi:hypothetical protein